MSLNLFILPMFTCCTTSNCYRKSLAIPFIYLSILIKPIDIIIHSYRYWLEKVVMYIYRQSKDIQIYCVQIIYSMFDESSQHPSWYGS